MFIFKIINWIKRFLNINQEGELVITEPLSPLICSLCNNKRCRYSDSPVCKRSRLRCEFECKQDGKPPSFCHYCFKFSESPPLFGYPDIVRKPTVYRKAGEDFSYCKDWLCSTCDKEKGIKACYGENYSNTKEAASNIFFEKDGLFYEGYHDSDSFDWQQPIEADFEISYETLAPYVKRVIEGTYPHYDLGVEFDGIKIREGSVFIVCEGLEYEIIEGEL